MTVKLYGHLQPGKNLHYVNSLPGLKVKSHQQACNNATNVKSEAVGSVVDFPASAKNFSGLDGAGNGIRTRDFNLGNSVSYCKN